MELFTCSCGGDATGIGSTCPRSPARRGKERGGVTQAQKEDRENEEANG